MTALRTLAVGALALAACGGKHTTFGGALKDVPLTQLAATAVKAALGVHASLIESRDWGLGHLGELARQASVYSGVDEPRCLEYLTGLDYGLSYPHLAGLTTFFGRLVERGRVPNGTLAFLPAA